MSPESKVVASVEIADEFRTRAQRCLKLAAEAPTLEARTHWLAMAQLWFNLAQHSEEQDALFESTSKTRSAKNGENGRSNGNGSGNSDDDTGH